jgi:O-antigen/teichoic acid export membrane protein
MTAAGTELADPARPELRSRVLSGFMWKMASGALGQGINTIVFVVLARLLAPKEFGIAAMAMVASAFVITYSDCGLGLALVQKDTISEADSSTVFWASVALGAIMAVVCIAVAPLVASFYHTPEVGSLLEVLSLSFFFTGLGSTHRSLQLRAMNFRVLEIRLMASAGVGGALTVALAIAGAGAWSIILGEVSSAAISTALLLALGGWRPRFLFSLQSLRTLGAFGFRYMGGATFTTLNSNADNILVGRVLGEAALGTYSLAYSVILVPLSRLASPIQQVLAPAFARLQADKEALAGNWLRGTRLVLMVFLPMMLTLSVTAPDVVHVVFGSKWDSAIPVMRILAPVCALLSVQGVADAALQAVGSMRTYLRMTGLSFALNITAFFIGIQWGLLGMATAFGIATLIFMTLYLCVVSRTIGSPLARLAGAVVGVGTASAALIVVEAGMFELLNRTDVGPLVRIAVTTVSGVSTFALVSLWTERESLVELGRIAAKGLPIPRRLLPQVLQSA